MQITTKHFSPLECSYGIFAIRRGVKGFMEYARFAKAFSSLCQKRLLFECMCRKVIVTLTFFSVIHEKK
jgi:hypothetical protein